MWLDSKGLLSIDWPCLVVGSKNITLISQVRVTKSQMDSLSTYALLSASFFFVALSFALLLRYRQISERINTSSDLGHDLWSSLEQRLKKQDERILDLVGRVDVIQARAVASVLAQAPSGVSPTLVASPLPVPAQAKPVDTTSIGQQVQHHTNAELGLESQESRSSHLSLGQSDTNVLDATQLAALVALNESPKSTRQLTDFIKKSREHTARVMKQLFESGLVERDASSKPYVYQLTDEGRRRLSGAPPSGS